MLFVTVFALFASVAFAAPSVDVKHLDQVVDIAIAEIAAREPKTFNEVTLRGLESLKRVHCELKNGVYTCTAVADKATISTPELKDHKVIVKIPIGVKVNGDIFEKFIIGETEVVVADEEISEDGLFGFWKKVKHAAKKAGHAIAKGAKTALKTAAQIAADQAKEAARQKAADLANKAIGTVLGKVGK